MTPSRRTTRAAAFVTAAAAAIPALLGTTPASAAVATPATSAARSTTANLIGNLAYRGAEHPYLVGNVADAAKRFGPASAQAKAATAGLTKNVAAIARLLSGGSPTLAATLRRQLLARDHAELAYAAAVLAAHRAGTTGTTAAEAAAIKKLDVASLALARTVHAVVPGISVAEAKQLLGVLNAGDRRTLTAAALGLPAQFADVQAASLSLGAVLAAIGEQAVGTPLARSRAVRFRAALEATFTEHVYQTGLFGEAVLLNGPGSPAAVAARKADDANTAAVSTLLRSIGAPADTRKVWNGHITGYSDYLTHLATGGSSVAAADKLFAAYERGIAANVHDAVPSLGTARLKTMFTMHVAGTLTVFKLEKAGSPALYPTAQMGAAMFAAFATQIAGAQTRYKG